jgi:hypothetical protein
METQSILFLSSLFIAISCYLYAQEAMPVAGGNITGNNGSLSYTVGRVCIEYQTATTGIVSLGVQQPYEIFHQNSAIERVDLTCLS